ncbi:hypothetical protein [Hoyosella altamirensis]|uniref:Uncharacterized protein n=1 Tax=Hoyosella altamirensis TaxID=616997 RepID=A0A839RKQ0_9ACTN|nr:hypothetical protein [Hoyosella altamirensis]MBB3036643.1 hypothetical protein [Hoyosella altamirensis]
MSHHSAEHHKGPGGSHREEIARDLLREHPEFDEPHLLEEDENVPPRPEEEIADAES